MIQFMGRKIWSVSFSLRDADLNTAKIDLRRIGPTTRMPDFRQNNSVFESQRKCFVDERLTSLENELTCVYIRANDAVLSSGVHIEVPAIEVPDSAVGQRFFDCICLHNLS